MSHAHIRARKVEPPPAKLRSGFWIYVSLMLAFVCAAFLWSNYLDSGFLERHITADGTIQDTRIALDRVVDSRYGGAALYRLEAHVTFIADGKSQDRWLRVDTGTGDRVELMAKANTHPRTCLVYWMPRHLDSARCKMDLY